MPEEDKRLHKPNGEDWQCQCVRDHMTLIDGDYDQCRDIRWREGSNLYCMGCEETHGDALSKKTVTA